MVMVSGTHTDQCPGGCGGLGYLRPVPKRGPATPCNGGVERIASRWLRDLCECKGCAAYVVGGKRLCAVAAEAAVPGTVPALPAGVRVVWDVDPLGEESARPRFQLPERYMVPCRVSTVYRILPGTIGAGHSWVSPLSAERHGYTMAHVLMSIRETFAFERFARVDRVKLVHVQNYGYSFIQEAE